MFKQLAVRWLSFPIRVGIMLGYFRDLVKVLARHTNPPKKWTWIGDFEAKDEEVVRNIIRAAEALEKK